jgi:hypothetical protein
MLPAIFYLAMVLGIIWKSHSAVTPGRPASVDRSLCCDGSDYSNTNFYNCINGKDFQTTPIASCATCVAYQCIDWTVGSASNAAREASYLAMTGESVYFGVGSYGSNQFAGGLCYRMTTSSIDRDLIVQVVNYGSDVPVGNFDLQVSDGGFGLFDACTPASTKMPQFDSSEAAWGVGMHPFPLSHMSPSSLSLTIIPLVAVESLRRRRHSRSMQRTPSLSDMWGLSAGQHDFFVSVLLRQAVSIDQPRQPHDHESVSSGLPCTALYCHWHSSRRRGEQELRVQQQSGVGRRHAHEDHGLR